MKCHPFVFDQFGLVHDFGQEEFVLGCESVSFDSMLLLTEHFLNISDKPFIASIFVHFQLL